MKVCLLVLFTFIIKTNAVLIQTEYEYQYYNKTISCEGAEQCTIRCLHQNGCKYSRINCPINSNCTIYFNLTNCGRYSIITASQASYLTIVAKEYYAVGNAGIIYLSHQ